MFVGAGTLLTTSLMSDAINAGALFGLSSSLNTKVCGEAKQKNFPFIPGVMTPSEIELAYELGYHIQKLFPASQIGGASFLKAMLGPYDQLEIKLGISTSMRPGSPRRLPVSGRSQRSRRCTTR